MAASGPASEQPLASVIVPARNEEASLGACLQSLTAQQGVNFEIIVVDDASMDRTREIAESFSNVRVVAAGPLPDNWSGKNNAMAAGAREANGKWLLFTDADTVHKPGSLARAVAEAEEHHAALLSYSPAQEVRGFWEKAVMPVIFAELACTYRPRDVCNPKSPVAAANGQYLLISREAYDAVGGHAAVSNNLLEDVALAQLVKTSGRRLRFRYGADAVRTRMYRNWSQMKEGWTKNLALLFSAVSNVAYWRLTEFLFIAVSLACGIFFLLLRETHLGASLGVAGVDVGVVLTPLVLALIVWGMFWNRVRTAHFSAWSNLLAIFGLPMFAYLLLASARLQKQGGITWRDRHYPAQHPQTLAPRGFETQGGGFLIATIIFSLLFLTLIVLLAHNGHFLQRR